ncbi:hypothetical protein AA309_29890 [Microvirga vignae]|uniref:Uncharacterized protein n=1 Tax=Microvirga vignae TaxID=1225564 RepID=A0A0H1R3K9_9HYPH|nr:hypothetical protein AA309_29890 [Microvirga vignae]
MPFLANDIQQDMQAFAKRLMPRLRKREGHAHFAMVLNSMVLNSLEQFTVSAGMDEVKALGQGPCGHARSGRDQPPGQRPILAVAMPDLSCASR